MVAGCATHPLDLIKVRMQLHGEALAQSARKFAEQAMAEGLAKVPKKPGVVAVGIKIVQKEGMGALFCGVSASALRQALYSSTRMGLYEILKVQWTNEDGEFPVAKKVAAALIAGGVGALVGNPADVAMVRMQADGNLPFQDRRNYTSVLDALVRMVKKEGFGSLYRGSMPTIQRAMIVTAAQLASYDQFKECLLANKVMKEGMATHFVASCLAGIVASLASNPIDVVKTRMMNMKIQPGCKPLYHGALHCAIKTIQTEGPMALYKGLTPTITRQAPFTILLFLTLEQIRRLLKDF